MGIAMNRHHPTFKATRRSSTARWKHWTVLMLLLVPLGWLGPAWSAAQIDMSLNPFLTLFPELRTAPAPSQWLKPGKRWTYAVQFAGAFDPDSVTPTSGSGFLQYDLVALTANRSAVSLKIYVDDSQGLVVPGSALSSIQRPGLGDFWLAPRVLVRGKAETVAGPELSVTRFPKSPANPDCPCVRFQSTRDDLTAEYVWMFQTATGKLVFYRHRIGLRNDPEYQAVQVRLRRERTLPLPWLSSSVRPWATASAWTLDFGGYQKIAFGYNDPSPVFLLYWANLARARYQSRWVEYVVTDYLHTDQTGWVPQTSLRSVTGTAQLFDQLFLPAEAYAVSGKWALNRWITLDRDPVTGATVFGRRIAGRSIVLREQGPITRFDLPIFQTDMRYRPSDGRLTRIVRTDVTDLLTDFATKTVAIDLQ